MAAGSKLAQYYVGLSDLLGHGVNKISIVTSSLLACISLFYVFSLGSYLQVTTYYFLLRFTYVKSFSEELVTRYHDSIIISSLTTVWLFLSLNGKARIFFSSFYGFLLVIGIVFNQTGLLTFLELSTLPVIVITLVYQRSYQKRTRKHHQKEIVRYFSSRLVINYLVIIAVTLGIYSILISLSVILSSQYISVENIFTTKTFPINNYGYEIFIFFSTISPLLLIVIFFCFPIRLLSRTVFQKIRSLGKRWRFHPLEITSTEEAPRKKIRIIYLSVFVLFSVSLAIIPQLSTVNKDNQQIGSDSDSYVEWISMLQQAKSPQDFFEIALSQLGINGDRPLALIFLFVLTSVINTSPLDTIEYLPVILSPALVVVTYFLTRELTSNETASLFAASITGLGYFQVSTGIYAGFYANWIALLVGYSSLKFFFRFLRTPSKFSPLIFFILLLVTLFSHALTWSILSIVMGVFLVVSFLLSLYPRRKIILLLLLVISSVIVDVTKTLVLDSIESAGGVELTWNLAQSNIGLKEFGAIWAILVDATQEHFGGIFCNVIILGLVMYWLTRSNLRRDFNIFIVVFFTIGIPSLFLGDWIVQSRVFYNIPFQIPAAIALTYISTHKNSPKILTPVYVWLIAISIWTVSNFYKVSPF